MKCKKEILSYVLSSFFLCYGNTQVIIDPVNDLKRITQERSEHKSISYSIDFKMKWFSTEDTMHIQADVDLARIPEDTLFGGWISIDMDSLWLGYNGSSIFNGNRKTSELTIVDPAKHPGAYIIGTSYINLVDEGFLKPNPAGLYQLFNDPAIHTVCRDTLIDSTGCLGITSILPDIEDFSGQTYFFALDTLAKCVRKKTYSVFFQGSEQYQEWNYYNVRYGNENTLPILEDNVLNAFGTVRHYEPKPDNEDEILQYDYSQLRGKLSGDDEYFDLKQENAEYILLDFWYSACYPCIKSIPEVNKVAVQYRDKGVATYGVNIVDDAVKSKSRIERFMRNNPMEYKTIMVDEAIKRDVPVSAHPTILLLDREFNVVFKEEGYDENLFEELSSVLDAILKK